MLHFLMEKQKSKRVRELERDLKIYQKVESSLSHGFYTL